ncbi:hypothetical protein T261_01540 [Streptomyces lydicus]|nr:hypothetical protein T261_01540 [Streptomyces lydicus]
MPTVRHLAHGDHWFHEEHADRRDGCNQQRRGGVGRRIMGLRSIRAPVPCMCLTAASKLFQEW